MRRLFIAILVVLIALLSAGPAASAPASVTWPTKGWATSTPEAQGMSSEDLAAFYTAWSKESFQLDSLLVVRNGYLVAEAYTPLNDASLKHNVYSVTKSVVSTLIGALIQDGLLSSLDTKVLSLFPDRTFKNVNARKQALTVRNLLTMSSGMTSDTSAADRLAAQMESADDALQFSLDQPFVMDPGAQWTYSNLDAQLLSEVITKLTGKTALAYATEKLFAPLGITDYRWSSLASGHSVGASELYLTPRDMAKLGYLYLNHGAWEGKQIIPADYADNALRTQIKTPWDGTTYGYLWWRVEPINLTFALGYGGQYVMVLPDKNLVVVMTAGTTEDLRVPLNGYPMFFATSALSASPDALPENAAGYKKLTETLAAVGKPTVQSVPPLPAMAKEVSGQKFNLFNPNLFFSSDFMVRSYHIMGLSEKMKAQSLALAFATGPEASLELGFVDGSTWSVPVGLDGVYRSVETRLGKIGTKGVWLADDMFRITMKNFGTAVMYRFDLNFLAPNAVNIVSYETTSGGAVTVMAYAPGE